MFAWIRVRLRRLSLKRQDRAAEHGGKALAESAFVRFQGSAGAFRRIGNAVRTRRKALRGGIARRNGERSLMLAIPAVDIRCGKAVRLAQGRSDRETVYSDDPVEAALRWEMLGAGRIHVVDLDGAFSGEPRNKDIVVAILKAVRTEVEVGGGLRTEADIAAMLDAGAARCVLGTRAAEDRGFLVRTAEKRPGRISVGIDAKDGIVVTRGWVSAGGIKAVELASGLVGLPLAEIIYTDVSRDGMLQGPNFDRVREMLDVSPFPLIASGGISSLDDVRKLRTMGVFGCIIGKALYDGRLDLAECIAAAGGTESEAAPPGPGK